jgi:hypothetical protein
MRANCEQIAVELPTPGVTDKASKQDADTRKNDSGETAENKKVTRTADVRIEAEEGHPSRRQELDIITKENKQRHYHQPHHRQLHWRWD